MNGVHIPSNIHFSFPFIVPVIVGLVWEHTPTPFYFVKGSTNMILTVRQLLVMQALLMFEHPVSSLQIRNTLVRADLSMVIDVLHELLRMGLVNVGSFGYQLNDNEYSHAIIKELRGIWK